jgi:D-alanyl-D-alanine carboxypeptidase
MCQSVRTGDLLSLVLIVEVPMRKSILLITVVLVLVSLAMHPIPTRAASLKEDLQAAADEVISAGGLPGVSLAVYHPTEGLILVTAGKSDLKAKTDLKTTDVARIASSSKVFVGTLIMQLIESGKVKLSDPISKYAGDEHTKHLTNAEKITIEHLLTHTSGLYDYFNPEFGADKPNKIDFTIEEALRYAWDRPAEFAPGRKFSYSNTNTLVLGGIVEVVTDEDLAAVMRARIFKPLGLKNIYTERFEPVPVKLVRGYEYQGDQYYEIGEKFAGRGLPDGGLVASPEELVKFLRALLVDGKLLKPETLKQMLTARKQIEGEETSICYHIFLGKTRYGVQYEHSGSLDGFSSEMMHFPEADITIALWTNSRGVQDDSVWGEFQSTVLEIVFGK